MKGSLFVKLFVNLLLILLMIPNLSLRSQDTGCSYIPTSEAGKMTCFNEGGIDGQGNPFSKTLNITYGRLQAMWEDIAWHHEMTRRITV